MSVSETEVKNRRDWKTMAANEELDTPTSHRLDDGEEEINDA